MKHAKELKEMSDAKNKIILESDIQPIINSMISVAKGGSYSFTTINPLNNKQIKIFEQNGYKVKLINYPPGSGGYCSEISWND